MEMIAKASYPKMVQGLFLTIIMIFDNQIQKAKHNSKITLKVKYFFLSQYTVTETTTVHEINFSK